MTRPIINIGDRFTRLVVLAPHKDEHGHRVCECLCDRGSTIYARSTHLRDGRTRSCGCLRKDMHTKHSMSGSPEYHAWTAMKDRCYNPEQASYGNYGGRGITICDAWRESFAAFYRDVGPRPSPHHSIERKMNSGNYEPDNCKWATKSEQNRNRRGNRILTLNDKSMCVIEWFELTGIKPQTIHSRKARGWSDERTLTTPVYR